MSTYAIGDVQGCYEPLQRLLEKIGYDPSTDTLWFVGDLVNRGPDSLRVLEFIYRLPSRVVVLGNHDLHLLAMVYGEAQQKKGDTLTELLQSSQCAELCAWLVEQPLLHHDPVLNVTMVHAGLLPTWDLATAMMLTKEVETILRSNQRKAFFEKLYSDEPACWSETLTDWSRWRFIVNCLTRLRFCTPQGCLNLNEKRGAEHVNEGEFPWFEVPTRRTQKDKIIFGHWAALKGECHAPLTYALDTGCVWGGALTALRLDDCQRFSVPASIS